jgi:hypothetical protein
VTAAQLTILRIFPNSTCDGKLRVNIRSVCPLYSMCGSHWMWPISFVCPTCCVHRCFCMYPLCSMWPSSLMCPVSCTCCICCPCVACYTCHTFCMWLMSCLFHLCLLYPLWWVCPTHSLSNSFRWSDIFSLILFLVVSLFPCTQYCGLMQGRIKLFGAARRWKNFRPPISSSVSFVGVLYYPADWVKHHASQSQDRNTTNVSNILFYILNFASMIKFKM